MAVFIGAYHLRCINSRLYKINLNSQSLKKKLKNEGIQDKTITEKPQTQNSLIDPYAVNRKRKKAAKYIIVLLHTSSVSSGVQDTRVANAMAKISKVSFFMK